MSVTSEKDQKTLNHLLSFLDQSKSNNASGGNQIIEQCLTEMLKAHPNINKTIIDITPYRDDAIFILIEALNLSGTDGFIMKANAIRVLENIGTHDAASLILENFNDYINRFNFSFTKMLTIIAQREGTQTKTMVCDRYIKYLIDENNPSTARRQNKTKYINSVLDSLIKMNIFDDPRLPALLESYIKRTDENSETHQLALLALAKADSKKAAIYINKKANVTSSVTTKIPQKQIRAVFNSMENNTDDAFLTLFIKKQETKTFLSFFTKKQPVSRPDETPYLFEFEKPLVYFLKDGTQDKSSKVLAGRAEKQDEVVRTAVQYLEMNLPSSSTPETRFQECSKLLSKHLDFKHWGFQQSFIQPETYPTIIYNSEWCRVKFAFESNGERFNAKTYLHVYYSRLHAPGNDSFMIWDGEKCWCWHPVDYALNFLDGLSPEEAIKVRFNPKIIEQYRQSDLAKKLSEISQAEWMAGMEAEIWKQYGQRLFELFDLRRPELWEQYVSFIQEFHKINETKSFGTPALEKIC